MRLLQNETRDAFAKFLLDVGNGRDGVTHYDIDIPEEMQSEHCKTGDINDLIDEVYPELEEEFKDENWPWFKERSILTPLNKEMDELNLTMMKWLEDAKCSTLRELKSVDKVTGAESTAQRLHLERDYPVEFLNALTPSGLPPHYLKLAPGVIIMLLRNLDVPQGDCNGTRYVIKKITPDLITAISVSGLVTSRTVYIPRLPITAETKNLPCIVRKQFPVRPAFAMTINKAQGQSLNAVGGYLPQPVFGHGQLYVFLSRATSVGKTFIAVPKGQTTMTNIVARAALSDQPERPAPPAPQQKQQQQQQPQAEQKAEQPVELDDVPAEYGDLDMYPQDDLTYEHPGLDEAEQDQIMAELAELYDFNE
jgi:ATP-dependent DNA helicase PIF1